MFLCLFVVLIMTLAQAAPTPNELKTIHQPLSSVEEPLIGTISWDDDEETGDDIKIAKLGDSEEDDMASLAYSEDSQGDDSSMAYSDDSSYTKPTDLIGLGISDEAGVKRVKRVWFWDAIVETEASSPSLKSEDQEK
jgi:hypothetical protein